MVEMPFNRRDYDRFGVELLRKNNIDVEVWDLSKVLNFRVFSKTQVPDPIRFDNYLLFNSKRDVLIAIESLECKAVIVCLIGYCLRSYSIYRAISRSNIIYVLYFMSGIPLSDNAQGDRKIFSLIVRIRNASLDKIIEYGFSQVPFPVLGIRPANFVLTAGENLIPHGQPVDGSSHRLSFHTLDYDLFLEEKEKSFELDRTMAVFLDEYLPFHPDYIRLGIEPCAQVENYYPSLCNFFNFLEGQFGFRIVVAAHPRSNYEVHPDYFGGRTVIRGNTIKLVKTSSLVIAHCSTSINFAILFKKPILLTSMDSFSNSLESRHIEAMATALGKKAIDIEKPDIDEVRKELNVNEEIYRRYRNKYIKRDGPAEEDKPFWQLFVDHLRREGVFEAA